MPGKTKNSPICSYSRSKKSLEKSEINASDFASTLAAMITKCLNSMCD